MGIEYAYSLELKRDISALEANQYCRQGRLKDKRAFKCIGSEDCQINLTCANFSALPSQWGVAPYYKPSKEGEEHSSNCPYNKHHKANSKNRLVSNKSSFKKTGHFNLILDNGGFTKSSSSSQSNAGRSSSSIKHLYTTNVDPTQKNVKKRNADIGSLKKLVDVFESDDYDNSATTVKINSTPISLEKLFHSLDDHSELFKEIRVYFGEAKIYERNSEDNFYIIEYTMESFHRINKKMITRKPSILIYKNQIQKHRHLRGLQKYVNTNSTFNCYFFGIPTLHDYINFELKNNFYNILFR
ncbi:hypothetical protein [Bacillus inaquosorum]|uniref:hypothetical protein n=1 Tax=Bacillus inaquosorum TaxID=483913 RepID=UPI00227ED5B2|nr:hypothetical protein [Bacillus inaquosorum]MCY8493167.1 hypothetical protein [Bacillus inaquosorum]